MGPKCNFLKLGERNRNTYKGKGLFWLFAINKINANDTIFKRIIQNYYNLFYNLLENNYTTMTITITSWGRMAEKRNLLGDLWSGDLTGVSEGHGSKGKRVEEEVGSNSGSTYAQVASSSSSLVERGQKEKWGKGLTMDRQGTVGAKRPRSPREGVCGRCFRSTHSTADCRHQVVYQRCSGVGHIKSRCLVGDRRSPRRRKVHVRSKLMGRKASSPELAREELPYRFHYLRRATSYGKSWPKSRSSLWWVVM